jgi:hypothetical protein
MMCEEYNPGWYNLAFINFSGILVFCLILCSS